MFIQDYTLEKKFSWRHPFFCHFHQVPSPYDYWLTLTWLNSLKSWNSFSFPPFPGQDHNSEYQVIYKMVAALWSIIGLAWATCTLISAQELFRHMHQIKATRKIVPEITQVPWHIHKKAIELKESDMSKYTRTPENTTVRYIVREQTIPSYSVYI